MWCEVTFLRRRGLRLQPQEWPPARLANLVVNQLHGPNNPFRQHMRMANLWQDDDSTSKRGVGTLFDPVILMTPGDGLLLRGIELETIDGRMYEYQQVWLCRPTQPMAKPLPPFKGVVSAD